MAAPLTAFAGAKPMLQYGTVVEGAQGHRYMLVIKHPPTPMDDPDTEYWGYVHMTTGWAYVRPQDSRLRFGRGSHWEIIE